jgi:4-hydroxybenzoate polyprenyltransferase
MAWWQKTKKIIKSNKYLNSFFNEFIYGGHLIAIGLCGVAILPAILLDIDVKPEFLLAIYLLSLGPCLFGRYVDLKKDALTNPERSVHIAKKVKILPYLIALCAIVSVWILFASGDYWVMSLGVGMIAMSFLYDLSLKNLTRKIIGFKNIYVGVLFTLLPVMMMAYHNAELSLAFWLVAMHVFVLTVIGSSYSDIKDIESDKKDGLKTFAIYFGHKNFIIFLVMILPFSVLPIIYGVYTGVLPTYSLMAFFTMGYVLYLFKQSFNKNLSKDYLYAVLCDAQLFLWFFFIFIGKVVFT